MKRQDNTGPPKSKAKAKKKRKQIVRDAFRLARAEANVRAGAAV